MPSCATTLVCLPRCSPLTAGIGAALALAAPVSALAATWTVNTCAEASTGSGSAGSLRYAVAHAATGDTVDMTGLTCSTISLQTGAITVLQDDLTLNGPGMDALYITGKYKFTSEFDRIFNHQGAGTLRINDLTISLGYLAPANGAAKGGCIYSKGSVTLNQVHVELCEAKSATSFALGGAVFTLGNFAPKYSIIEGNFAYGAAGFAGFGGAAYVGVSLISKYTTVSDNTASNNVGTYGFGGGLNVLGNVNLLSTTISGNRSTGNVGGLNVTPASASASAATVTITNSTISGNQANGGVGGMYSGAGTLELYNSTIAFNAAVVGRSGSTAPFLYYSPGVAIGTLGSDVSVVLDSTLISNNTYGASGTSESDISVNSTGSFSVTFSGANNLVRRAFPLGVALPGDTIVTCPLLGALRDNGGLTFTHALLGNSPAIDKGSNVSNATFDQRGTGFDRVSGVSALADIGAYEVQQDEVIFGANFEGCPI